jgi:hypothetical protein
MYLIDLDVDSAFELAQMHCQLSRWQIHWLEIWRSNAVGWEPRIWLRFGQIEFGKWVEF